jgi:hypothetical protein
MDKLLLRGEQLNAVARRYSISEDALGRHKRHMQLVIAKAAAVADQKTAVLSLVPGRLYLFDSSIEGRRRTNCEWPSNSWR